eukprot:6183559-Pleurochrysis_carterae.AAC.1
MALLDARIGAAAISARGIDISHAQMAISPHETRDLIALLMTELQARKCIITPSEFLSLFRIQLCAVRVVPMHVCTCTVLFYIARQHVTAQSFVARVYSRTRSLSYQTTRPFARSLTHFRRVLAKLSKLICMSYGPSSLHLNGTNDELRGTHSMLPCQTRLWLKAS